jgi:hypothetical protein
MTTTVSLNDESAAVAPVASVFVDQALAPASRFGAVTVIDDRHAMVKDNAGRLLKVKRLSALDRVRLFRAMGATDSTNPMLQSYAATAAAVIEIDGRPVVFPQSSVSLDALIGRLDEAGLEAVVLALLALAPKAEDGTQAIVGNS